MKEESDSSSEVISVKDHQLDDVKNHPPIKRKKKKKVKRKNSKVRPVSHQKTKSNPILKVHYRNTRIADYF